MEQSGGNLTDRVLNHPELPIVEVVKIAKNHHRTGILTIIEPNSKDKEDIKAGVVDTSNSNSPDHPVVERYFSFTK